MINSIPIIRYISFIIFIITMPFCKEAKSKSTLSSNILFTKENFSDIFLDSLSLRPFFKDNRTSDSIIKEVVFFYKERSYQYAWINSKGLTQAASSFYIQLQNYTIDFDDNRFLNIQLDSLIENVKENEKYFLANKNNMEQLELLLTTTYFSYAKNIYGGITKDTKDLRWYIPRNKKDYQALLDTIITNKENKGEPVNKYYASLKIKFLQYRALEKNNQFTKKINFKKILSLNDMDTCISKVKYHLFAIEDLKENDKSDLFTNSLEAAIKHFQYRFGLKETGKLDKPTLEEMNIPIANRIKQIIVNMERLRWMPIELEKSYLLVNIPEFKLHFFENDKLEWETNVVVGKVLTQTNIFKGDISKIVLNPYWNVPNSIYRKEIKGRISKSYLAKNNMEMYNGGVRQKPSVNNALGKVKFLFPNNFNIYLHDTPSKSLLNETKRGFSHGCIRVQEPLILALYLLRKDKNWTSSRIDSILNTNKEYPINLTPTIPVYIAYFTAWVNSKGKLNFRNDIYNLDEKLGREIFSE